MSDNLDFYKWFDAIATKLGEREISFRKIFRYLDDSPAFGNLTQSENESKPTWKILNSPAPSIGGKGFLVHEYAKHVGAKVVFSHYQAAWNNFNN